MKILQKYSKTVVSFIFTLYICLNTMAQIDTTICINIKKNLQGRKNTLSLEAVTTTYPLFFDGYGLGLNYERAVGKRSSFMLTCSGFKTKDTGSDNNDWYQYFTKFGYRFYLRKGSTTKIQLHNKTYKVAIHDYSTVCMKGFHVAPVAVIAGSRQKYENKESEFHGIILNGTEYLIEELNFIYYGLGLSVGYQFFILNKIVVDFTLPVSYGLAMFNLVEHETYKHIQIPQYTPLAMVNVNIGYLF